MLFPPAGSTIEYPFGQTFTESEEVTLPAFDIPENFTGRLRADIYCNTVDTSAGASNGTLGHWLRRVVGNVRRVGSGPVVWIENPKYDTTKDDISTGNYGIAAVFVIAGDGLGVQLKITGIPSKKLYVDGIISIRGRIADSEG